VVIKAMTLFTAAELAKSLLESSIKALMNTASAFFPSLAVNFSTDFLAYLT